MMMNDEPQPHDESTPVDSSDLPWYRRDLTANKAALARIRRTLDTDAHWTDDQGYIRSTNDQLDDAKSFIRDHLDPETSSVDNIDFYYEHLTKEQGQQILDDLALIWDIPTMRDEITRIAIELSLCPLHLCDWASCFDDDDDECSAIRAIYPYSHDT